ncbi:hypothetical protein GCM10007366_19980 [Mammaliicoccus vitulinus]|nr:hypothetical protein GCM10007366_19980 [Mammaliicoccus vitulinus]
MHPYKLDLRFNFWGAHQSWINSILNSQRLRRYHDQLKKTNIYTAEKDYKHISYLHDKLRY